MTTEANIADVGTWKEETDHVKINIKPDASKGVVVKMEKGSKLNITHNETSLEIVVGKKTDPQGGPNKEQDTNAPNKPSETQGISKKGEGDKQSDDASNASRKSSDNVLGNVVNMLKEYKGIVITAVIAISLGFLLRRKFKLA